MLGHCVNPNCSALLNSFSEGRLYQFEIVSISISASDDSAAPFDERPHSETVQFWLCGRCATSISLVMEPTNGLKLVPIAQQPSELRGVDGGLGAPKVNSC